MLSIERPDQSGGQDYGAPFVGPVDHTLALTVVASGLTTDEVDEDGYLKPGVPFTAAGTLVAAMTKSAPDAGTSHQNAAGALGNGTITGVSGRFGAPAETITVTMTGTGATAAFSVDGTKSGHIGTGAVGTAFDSSVIGFTINDGSTDWTAGNTIDFVVTGGVQDTVQGVVMEAQKIAAGNDSTSLSDAGSVQVVVGTIGQINRAVVEDNLGRALTVAEVAGFVKSNIVLG